MSDFTISAAINGDASGFASAIDDALGSLSSFASQAASVFAGVEAATGLNSLVSMFGGVVSSAVGAASSFNDFGVVANAISGSVSDSSEAMGNAVSGSGAKVKVAAEEAQDALIKYNEKIAEIQQNITDVMTGSNVTDARQKMQDSLVSMEEQYAQKIKSINAEIAGVQESLAEDHENRVQSMNNSLADMQANHDNQVADRAEKQAYTISQLTTAAAKAAKQKQFDAENKIADDAYARQYATKQAQLQRDLDQADAKAKEAADKKIAHYQAELAQEAKAESEKEAKLKEQGAKEISRLEEENAKKLAKYQQELADEERSYQLSLDRRAAAAAGGGGGKGNALKDIGGKDEFAITKDSAESLVSYMQQMQDTTPFNIEDLRAVGEQFELVNVNAQKLTPVIEDMSGHFQKNFKDVGNAVFTAMEGNYRGLRQFGIQNKEDLERQSGVVIHSQNDILMALQKIATAKWGDGIAIQGQTASGQMALIHNNAQSIFLDVMGIDQVTGKPLPDGLFIDLMNMLKGIVDFIKTNKPTIEKSLQDVGIAFNAVSSAVGKVMNPIIKEAQVVWTELKPHIDSIIKAAGTLLADLQPLWDFFQKYIIPVLEYLGKTTIALVVVPQLKIMADTITTLINLADQFVKSWDNAVKGFSDNFDKIKNLVSSMGDKIMGTHGLNPKAHGSPSLVEEVQSGIALIKEAYGSFGSFKIPAPQFGGAGGGGTTYNYNSSSSPNVNQSNTFNIASQANASNIAEYLGFQLAHRGIV